MKSLSSKRVATQQLRETPTARLQVIAEPPPCQDGGGGGDAKIFLDVSETPEKMQEDTSDLFQ